MWEWSRMVAEKAAAAAWARTRPVRTEPRYGEPECWAEAVEAVAVEAVAVEVEEGAGMLGVAGDPIDRYGLVA